MNASLPDRFALAQPRRTRIKICGITSKEEARIAAQAGADAIGVVFYPPSPRAVTIEAAATIVAALPPFVTAVGLFVNPRAEEVRAVLERVPLSLLQFHGQESAEFCRQFGVPYLKAFPATAATPWRTHAHAYDDAAGWLVDTPSAQHGGTGQTFDWSLLPPPQERPVPLVLAGGLTPENVGAAIRQVHPWAVDVSSGVERAKGVKDRAKIEAFVAAVRAADAANRNGAT